MEAHYIGFKMWKQAVEQAGTTDVDAVRQAMYGQKVKAPSGFVEVMNTNHHLSKPVMIGEIQANGQFDVVWQTKDAIKADAWRPTSQRIRARLPTGLIPGSAATARRPSTLIEGQGKSCGAGPCPFLPPPRKWAEREIGAMQVHLAWLRAIFILLAAALPARADRSPLSSPPSGLTALPRKSRRLLLSVSSVTGGPSQFFRSERRPLTQGAGRPRSGFRCGEAHRPAVRGRRLRSKGGRARPNSG